MKKIMAVSLVAVSLLNAGLFDKQKNEAKEKVSTEKQSVSEKEKVIKIDKKEIFQNKKQDSEVLKVSKDSKDSKDNSGQDDYEKIVKILSEKPKETKQEKEERLTKELYTKKVESLNEASLPDPIGYTIIGNKISVYGILKKPIFVPTNDELKGKDFFSEDAEGMDPEVLKLNIVGIKFKEKRVEIKKWTRFSPNWLTVYVDKNKVIYKNTKTNKTIIKYY